MARRFGLTSVIIAAFMLALAGQAQAERRVALVIGNGNYQNAPRLANPGNDAVAIAGLLRKAGFDRVELRRDLGDADSGLSSRISPTRRGTPTSRRFLCRPRTRA